MDTAGYTKLPDCFVDHWLPKLGAAEVKVWLYGWRMTHGFGKSADTIAVSQFVGGLVKRTGDRLNAGTGLKARTVFRALEKLEAAGLVHRTARTGKPTSYRFLCPTPVPAKAKAPVPAEAHPEHKPMPAEARVSAAAGRGPMPSEAHTRDKKENSQERKETDSLSDSYDGFAETISWPPEDGFGHFIDSYPKQTHLQEATDAYQEIIQFAPRPRAEWNKLMAGKEALLHAIKRGDQDPAFAPNPSDFIRRKRYLDDWASVRAPKRQPKDDFEFTRDLSKGGTR